jgi:hypothetical protein
MLLKERITNSRKTPFELRYKVFIVNQLVGCVGQRFRYASDCSEHDICIVTQTSAWMRRTKVTFVITSSINYCRQAKQ